MFLYFLPSTLGSLLRILDIVGFLLYKLSFFFIVVLQHYGTGQCGGGQMKDINSTVMQYLQIIFISNTIHDQALQYLFSRYAKS